MHDLEVRVRDLERRLSLRRLEVGQLAGLSQRLGLAYAAASNVGRDPVPWLPRGTVMVRYRVLGPCGVGPIAGALVTTLYAGVVVDQRATTPDGYATFFGVAGVTYSYTVVAPLNAVNGSYTLSGGGLALNVNVPLPSGWFCFGGTCPAPISQLITDPQGTFTANINGSVTRSINASNTAVHGTCASPGPGTVPNVLYQSLSPTGLLVRYPTCDLGPGGLPSRNAGAVTPNGSITGVATSFSCSPFRVEYSVSGGRTADLYGTDPITITIEPP